MKLQVAIDRVTLYRAVDIAHSLDGKVDIIELGTSIVKDYGLEALKQMDFHLEKSELLIDLKTIDEGEYEFKKGFETSADILTVMGSSSNGTLIQTHQIAQDVKKDIFVDLMEINDDRLNSMPELPNAIFGLHHSKDSVESFDAVDTIKQFNDQHPQISRLAVAGGIDIDQAKKIADQGIADIIIVGGKISGTSNPVSAAQKFMEAIK